ncbi:MAG TPA: hypothetical protein PLM53_17450 [Spirochaetota bacterium]|nr:hypothetical protein [Spirochaetota bacterium]HQF09735.1 hypothetical protein [Spirochaetota bacterium]HQH98884.1 hypothetical protein [Spirochaetota bacterium]
MKKLVINLMLCHLGLLLLMAAPVLSLDQVIKLYMCQTEHNLEEITACEYSDPGKYRQATKNGRLTPLEAAQAEAETAITLERIQCDQDKKVVTERYRGEGTARAVYLHPLEGAELEQYCPRTIKKHGHPCR